MMVTVSLMRKQSNFSKIAYIIKKNFHIDKDDISPRVHRGQDWNTCRYISLSVNSFQMEEVGLIHMVYFVLLIIVISCINSKFLTKFYFFIDKHISKV